MKTNKLITAILGTALLTASASAIASGFNPSQFAAEQTASMQAEQQTYDSIANKSINDLHAFLKKNGINAGADGKPQKPSSYESPAPAYQAPAATPDQHYQTQAGTKSNSNQSTQRPNNLPLNVNTNSQQTSWSYKL
jgi:hypothetical protein